MSASGSDPTVLPRVPVVRGASPRLGTWWARAFVRSAEETAYAADDLVAARALARSGRLGAVMVIASMASAVVDPGRGADGARVVTQLKVAPLADWDGLVTELARQVGFVAALEAGELPDELVEAADQAGVELLPGPADLTTGCACEAWTQPCVHSLALAYQLAWALDRDPYLLLLLRGRPREWVLDEARSRVTPAVGAGEQERDAARALAARLIDLAAAAPSGEGLAASAVARYDEQVAALIDGVSDVSADRPGPAPGPPRGAPVPG